MGLLIPGSWVRAPHRAFTLLLRMFFCKLSLLSKINPNSPKNIPAAWLAQSVEHGTLNPRVVGSSPTSGVYIAFADGLVSFLKLIQTLQNHTVSLVSSVGRAWDS